MSWSTLAIGFAAGFLVAAVTAPVGVSGAVFLLPVQLDVLRVPSPSVTPTNLLYNVVSAPGALWRYHRQGRRPGRLTVLMLAGTLPGVLGGAVVRVHAIPDVDAFRLVAAAVLLPIGVWLTWRSIRGRRRRTGWTPSGRAVVLLGLLVGVVGGVYGIGGGSILAPVLVACGLDVAKVAPAALTSTFVTSIAGALSFGLLAQGVEGSVAPDWTLGVVCGLGGLVGGSLGARWQTRIPERVLAALLGITAAALASLYTLQAIG